MLAATKPATPIRSVAPHVPPDVAFVVDRALAFERSDRWPSARAMREALGRARPALATLASEPPPTAAAVRATLVQGGGHDDGEGHISLHRRK